MDIALILEAMKLLVVIGHKFNKVEEFIFRLLNSKNTNSRFLGFRYAVQLKILPEVVISRVFELGIDKKVYFDSLLKLIDASNFKVIYQKLDAFKQISISGRLY